MEQKTLLEGAKHQINSSLELIGSLLESQTKKQINVNLQKAKIYLDELRV